MFCIKCGREIQEGQVFCPDCLEVMARFPVSPNAHAIIPRRPAKPEKKPAREVKPEELIAGLKKRTRRLWVAVILLAAAVGVLSLLLVQAYTRKPAETPTGRNYTTTGQR